MLMTNHVHLLITPEKENSAAQLMKNMGQRYVQYVNRTYQRSGTLWSPLCILAPTTLDHPCPSGVAISFLFGAK